MAFAFDVVETVRAEEPDLFDDEMVAAGAGHARRGGRVRGGSSPRTCSSRACPGCRWPTCARTCSTSPTGGWPSSASTPIYGSANPFAFMELQDVQELSNFFERRVSAYQVGVSGTVAFDDDF